MTKIQHITRKYRENEARSELPIKGLSPSWIIKATDNPAAIRANLLLAETGGEKRMNLFST